MNFVRAIFKASQKAAKLYGLPVEALVLKLKLLLVFSVLFCLLFLDSLEFWENSVTQMARVSIILELEVTDKTSVEIEVEIVHLVFYVLVPDAGLATSE